MNDSTTNKHSTVDHFDDAAKNWGQLYESKPAFIDRRNLFVGMVAKHCPSNSIVLDFGCGSGDISTALAAEGHTVVGLDGSSKMVEAAIANHSHREVAGTLSFQQCDAQYFENHLETYDAIVCSSVIEYLDDDTALLSQFRSRLNPGGRIFVSIPHSFSLVGKLEDAVTSAMSVFGKPRESDNAFAKRRYVEAEFARRCDSIGLCQLDKSYFELPYLGQLGVGVSRLRLFGVMLLCVLAEA